MWGAFKIMLLEMPPHPIPVFTAPDAPVVPDAVPLDLDTESEGDVMEIQQKMDAKRKRLKDAMKAQFDELREKKQKEKVDWKRQEELDRERQEEEVWKEVDWKKQEDLKHLKKTIKSQWEGKQVHWVDINGVSSILYSMIQN